MKNPLLKAKWIGCEKSVQSPIIIRHFQINKIQKATLFITGLGYFEAKINEKKVCNDKFIPVVSDYEERPLEKLSYPLHDITTHAVYYYEYDVTSLISEGNNTLTIQLGNGFYRQMERVSDGPVHFSDTLKAIYALILENDSESVIFYSDGTETWKESEITYNNLYIGEVINATSVVDKEYPVFILESLNATLRKAIGSPDRVIRKITPTLLGTVGSKQIFDVGENVSGVVRVHTKALKGEKIRLRFAEKLHEDLILDFASTGARYTCSSGRRQIMEDVFITDGTERDFEPKFIWHTFQYFEIEGNFETIEVLVIHSDTPVTATFASSSEGLNFLWDAFVRTQLDNMHGSIPSDCPHRERLGYTGDGQVCAPTVMMILDSKEFYRKWIQDILDCQDKVGGHVQHTAPLMGGGGGPGGWGCAIVIVPYTYYKYYGEIDMITHCYEPMKCWIQYLLTRCENGLVVREEPRGWCLGEWLTLEKTILPESFVNTCYFVKSLCMLSEMALVIGKESDAIAYTNLANELKQAIRNAYFDKETGHYCQGIQGADAYAVWAGLVAEDELITHVNDLALKYKQMGHFDTGFLGTDILAEVLMEYGYADVLFQLLESEKLGSFLYMKRQGATTIWEDWKGTASLCHPMFGGLVRQFFTGFLGIRQAQNSVGYKQVEIRPCIPENLPYVNGSLLTPRGEIRVSWDKHYFEITIPEQIEATFIYKDITCKLQSGVCTKLQRY